MKETSTLRRLSDSYANGGKPIRCALLGAEKRLGGDKNVARFESEVLLADVLGWSRSALYARPEYRLTARQAAHFDDFTNRRCAGEPIPYITGRCEFFSLELQVDHRVLIPRPETETLVETALEMIACQWPVLRGFEILPAQTTAPIVADVGTGCGCIAIAIAMHAPHARILALDLSPEALSVAALNARRHVGEDRIAFLESDLLRELPERVDLIVSNPPYVAAKDWAELPVEIREHEPRLALDGGSCGLSTIRNLLREATFHMSKQGALLIEMGANQVEYVIALARENFPTAEIDVVDDLAGRPRVLRICLR